MADSTLTEQDKASMTGPRDMKTPGEVDWCWQTVSALQSMWKSLDLDYERYQRAWAEAEEHRIWERIPPTNPYGSKKAMLERLQVGDEESAKARVAAQAIPARPMPKQIRGRNGRFQSNPPGVGPHPVKRSRSGADYLTARIARDRPDIWERMKNGEFTSVPAAAREAGITVKNPKRVILGNDVAVVASALTNHYTPDQLQALIDALTRAESEGVA